MKGYIGANQSRTTMSKTMTIIPETKISEKMNISTTKAVIQVILFRILSLFENEILTKLMK